MSLLNFAAYSLRHPAYESPKAAQRRARQSSSDLQRELDRMAEDRRRFEAALDRQLRAARRACQA